ncbi:MAG: type II secretion system F family protein [Actinomycetia bacterium]|nr:type II secretion system F family protein [Actinomycetes bacterium]
MIREKSSKIAGILNIISGERIRNPGIFLILTGILYLWFQNILLALFISACSSIYIIDIFNAGKRGREQNLHKQLIEFLEHMVIMLRAGKTLRYIFLNSWKKFPDPLGKYLKEVAEGLEINPDLEEMINMLEDRSKSREVRLITSGIKINSKTGGDLAALLNSISITLRESLRSKSRLNSLTLQSRLSANIISLFPVTVLLFLYLFYSDRILEFFSTPAGIIVLIIGGSLEISGIISMKKIIRE